MANTTESIITINSPSKDTSKSITFQNDQSISQYTNMLHRNRLKVQGAILLDLPRHTFHKFNSSDELLIKYHEQPQTRRNSGDSSEVSPNISIGNIPDHLSTVINESSSTRDKLVEQSSLNERSQYTIEQTSKNISRLASINLLGSLKSSDPNYSYDLSFNPKRVLTKPSKPFHNIGLDNENHDYILYVGDVFGNEEGRKFIILDMLGHGTFGQVVKAQNMKSKELVAIKIIKNQTAYFNQSMMEVTILEMLNQKYDSSDLHHITRMKDTFIYKRHLCIVFELLSLNLFELVKQNHFKGFSHQLIRIFLNQILDALCLLKEAKIVHCDLKPENILLKSMDSPEVKVIDFGSACHEQHTVYTYIQSRFYRSPEVLLGLPYSSSIDVWSFGCIAAELFLGLPVFPGSSNYDQMSRIIECVGLPPSYMLDMGKNASCYFELIEGRKHQYHLKSREQYCIDNRINSNVEKPSKRYFSSVKLEDIIKNYPLKTKAMTTKDIEIEKMNRLIFIDFLHGLLNLNPLERWSPQQAKMHPYLTGEQWIEPYVPPGIRSSINTLDIAQDMKPVKVSGKKASTRQRAMTINSQLYNIPPEIQRLAAAAGGTACPPGGVSQNIQDYRMGIDIPEHHMSNSSGSGSSLSRDMLHIVEDDHVKQLPTKLDINILSSEDRIPRSSHSGLGNTYSLQQRRVSNPSNIQYHSERISITATDATLASSLKSNGNNSQKKASGTFVTRQILPLPSPSIGTWMQHYQGQRVSIFDSSRRRSSMQYVSMHYPNQQMTIPSRYHHLHNHDGNGVLIPPGARSVPIRGPFYSPQLSPYVASLTSTVDNPRHEHSAFGESMHHSGNQILSSDINMKDASHLSQSLPHKNFYQYESNDDA